MNWYDSYSTAYQSGEASIPSRLDQIRTEENKLIAEKGQLIEKGLQSHNPDILLKANAAWEDVQNRSKDIDRKSLLVDPNKWNDAEGYKRKPLNISGSILRKMTRATPVIKAIISTRQTQVSAFASPQSTKYDTGFVIRKKREYYTSEEPKLSSADKQTIKSITNFLLDGGDSENAWYADNFDTFLKKITEDSLILDAASFEVVRNRGGVPVKYFAVDGETIRIADSYDDENYEGDRIEDRGYYPSFVQIIEGTVNVDYYPWELCYGIRNATTDISKNGYGRSELEDLINVITWMLNGDAYNGKFFTQGAAPRGLLQVSGNVNRNRLAQFRQSWQAMVAGVQNAWKVPVIESENMNWIDLQKSNTDMQFQIWQEYLIKIACAIYKIAPDEIGFNASSGGGSPMFEGNNEARLKFSRDKGLRPLLKSIEAWINKYLVNPIDSDFEFAFVGLDIDSEEKEVELLNKKVQHGMGIKEWRRAVNLPEDFEEGDFPLNSVYLQMQSQLQFSEMQDANTEEVDEDAEAQEMWDSLDDSGISKAISGHEKNPMLFDALEYFNQKVLQSDDQ